MEETKTDKTVFLVSRGVTLIELMVVLVIFSVVMAGLYSSYSVVMQQGVRQYKLAQSEMDLQIAKTVIERDLAMAGYGIADSYCAATVNDATCTSGIRCNDTNYTLCLPVHLRGTPNLTLMGTALGRDQRATQAWSYTLVATPTTAADFKPWADAREQLKTAPTPDKIIYINPFTKTLLNTDVPNNDTQKKWLFPYPGTSSTSPYPTMADDGTVVFGITSDSTATIPYTIVQYSLGGTPPSGCAQGALNLQRLESKSDPPTGAPQPLLDCVLDYEVALGLDVSGNGSIGCWDNSGAACAAGYPNETLRTQLKQVKVYVLVQQGNRDPNYTYGTNPVRVGDLGLSRCVYTGGTCTVGAGGVGQNITLTAEQQHYRWKVMTLEVAPRNIR